MATDGAAAKPKLSGKLMQLKARAAQAQPQAQPSLCHAADALACACAPLLHLRHRAAQFMQRSVEKDRVVEAETATVRRRTLSRVAAASLGPPPPPLLAHACRPDLAAAQAAAAVAEHWVVEGRDGTSQAWCVRASGSLLRVTARPVALTTNRAHRFRRCGVVSAPRSTVIMEGDPKPGALMGRMSFRREPVRPAAGCVSCALGD
jgi:hypothetical protein